jgi:hypothetical protein
LFILQLLEPAVSAARLQSQLLLELLVAVATGATFFQLLEPLFSVASASLSEPLSESPSTIAAVTKVKILSIDLEHHHFDGITNSTCGMGLVSTIAKAECLILRLLLLRCVQL